MASLFNRQKLLLLFGDFTLILFCLQISGYIRFNLRFNVLDYYTGATLFSICIYLLSLYIFDLYDTRKIHYPKEIFARLTAAILLTALMSAILFYVLPTWRFIRGIYLIQLFLAWTVLFIWRWGLALTFRSFKTPPSSMFSRPGLLYTSLFQMAGEKENVIIIGAGLAGQTIYKMLKNDSSPYRVIGFVDDDPSKQADISDSLLLGSIYNLSNIASQYNIRKAIFTITNKHNDTLMRNLVLCRCKGLTIIDMPKIVETVTGKIPVSHIKNEWLIFATGFNLLSGVYIQRVKRLIDFAASSILLVVGFPVILISSILIQIDSKGPIFFKQKRIGNKEEVFTIWKLRSMYPDAEKNGAVWAKNDDCRITRAGKWIRKLRIDELPQLINVFRGEMSLVGPRPERPEFIKKLEKEIPYYGIRHSVRPGVAVQRKVDKLKK